MARLLNFLDHTVYKFRLFFDRVSMNSVDFIACFCLFLDCDPACEEGCVGTGRLSCNKCKNGWKEIEGSRGCEGIVYFCFFKTSFGGIQKVRMQIGGRGGGVGQKRTVRTRDRGLTTLCSCEFILFSFVFFLYYCNSMRKLRIL